MWTIIPVLSILCTTSVTTSVNADEAIDVQQLLQRVQQVEDKGQQHEVTIATMRGQMEQLEGQVNHLEGQVHQLEGQVAALETSNLEKQAVIDELQDKLNDVSDVLQKPGTLDDAIDNTLAEILDRTLENTVDPETEPPSYQTDKNAAHYNVPNIHNKLVNNVSTQQAEQTETNTYHRLITAKNSTQAVNNNRQHTKQSPNISNSKPSRIHRNNKDKIQTQRIQRQTPGHVVFRAYASGTQTNLHEGEHVILDGLWLNVGDAYYKDHGVFIAPVSGMYVFSVTLMNYDAHGDDKIQVGLVKNGSSRGRLMADGRNGGSDQGSMTVPIQLVEGDEVWLNILAPTAGGSFYGGLYTSFSGFLLYTL